MTIKVSPANLEKLCAQVQEVDQFIGNLEREQRPLRGKLLMVMTARVALLEHLDVVPRSITGIWYERLTKAAARPEPADSIA